MTKGYYVYALQDSSKPFTKADKYGLRFEPFYVGKGTGNRSEIHEKHAAKYEASHNPRLLLKIQQLVKAGTTIVTSNIFESDVESEAYEKEAEALKHYGLQHKGGILVNASFGKAGGWGADLNPTYARMKEGTHNFLSNNPQFVNPKLQKLSKLIKSVKGSVDIKKSGWTEKTGYNSTKALRLGILRVIKRENLPYKLNLNTLIKLK